MITPKGKLMYVHINGHEEEYPKGNKTGRYTATLELTEENYNRVRDELTKIWEASDEYKEVADVVEVMNPNLGVKKKKDKKTGEIHYLLKAKLTRFKVDKAAGEKTERFVTIEDGARVRLADDTKIFNGSEGRLMVYPRPYNLGANYGVSLYLQKIQLTKAATGNTEEFPVDDEDMEEAPF